MLITWIFIWIFFINVWKEETFEFRSQLNGNNNLLVILKPWNNYHWYEKKNLSRTVKILKINQTDPSSHCVSTMNGIHWIYRFDILDEHYYYPQYNCKNVELKIRNVISIDETRIILLISLVKMQPHTLPFFPIS